MSLKTKTELYVANKRYSDVAHKSIISGMLGKLVLTQNVLDNFTYEHKSIVTVKDALIGSISSVLEL